MIVVYKHKVKYLNRPYSKNFVDSNVFMLGDMKHASLAPSSRKKNMAIFV